MKVPTVTARKAIRAFAKLGYYIDDAKRGKGSHIRLRDGNGVRRQLTLPGPLRRELATGTLRKLIKHAGISIEEFVELLR